MKNYHYQCKEAWRYLATITELAQKILHILQNDYDLRSQIKEFRFGEQGSELTANNYPLCYVTLATNPEVSRDDITSSLAVDELPTQIREYEFWVIIIVGNLSTPEKTQKKLYDITDLVQSILSKNVKLDGLCRTLKLYTQRRLESRKGTLLEAMTIRVRTTIIV